MVEVIHKIIMKTKLTIMGMDISNHIENISEKRTSF